ncbi:MAG TPA: DUF3566 domain-containing protein, partial [Propionibacteriaceae bacterium]|nr:DUF3566 domain-containing protein [Propionibacteriaceae bacterium]
MSEANPDRKRWSDDPAAPSTDASTGPAESDSLRRRPGTKPRTGAPRLPRPAAAAPRAVTPTQVPPADSDAPNETYRASGTSFSADLDPLSQTSSSRPAAPARLEETPTSPDTFSSPAGESSDAAPPTVLERAKAGVVAAAAVAREKVAQVSTAATATAPAPPAVAAAAAGNSPVRRPRRTRRARLRISRIDPWSVMKTSLLFGIAGGIIFVVATYVLMSVVEATGLFEAINSMVKDVLASPSDTTTFDITTYINTKRATGLAALIGAIDVVIFTALATVFSF